MKPSFITFTGAGDDADLDEMLTIASEYPVEWGILFSNSRQGTDPRYPSWDGIARILRRGLRCSAHICGSHSQAIMDGNLSPLSVDLRCFERLQINHTAPNVERIHEFQQRIDVPCIAQARGTEFPPETSIGWLFDASGGRGIAPAAWPKHPGRRVGYAGGITPANVAATIKTIVDGGAVDGGAVGTYWLDMESGVRTDDRFDLSLVRAVCAAVFG